MTGITSIKTRIRPNGVSIIDVGGDKYLQLHLVNPTNGVIGLWNNNTKTNAAFDNNTHNFKIDNDPTHNVRPDAIEFIKIKFSSEASAKVYGRLAILRNLIKNDTRAEIGEAKGTGTQDVNWTIITKIKYDCADAATTYLDNEDNYGIVDGTARDIKLVSSKAFDDSADGQMICIDDENWTNGTAANVNRYSYKKITDEYWALDNLSLEIEKMLSGDEGLDNTKIGGWLTKLREYAKAANVAKNFLYNANFTANFGTTYFKTKIDDYHKLLSELKVWKDCGFDNVKEVLKANANGITIATRGTSTTAPNIGDGNVEEKDINDAAVAATAANITNIKKVLSNGEYKGVKVFGVNGNQVKATDFAVDGTLARNDEIYGLRFNAMAAPYDNWKQRIDNFRHNALFPLEIGGVKLFTSGKREDCLGFQPCDIIHTAQNYRGGAHGIGYLRVGTATTDSLENNTYKDKTKIVVDIWMAANLDQAINLAFFGQDYAGKPATPQDYRYFNEISGKNKLEILEMYYKAFERDPTDTDAAKAGWLDKTANGGEAKIKAAYNKIKKFLEIYTIDVSSYTKDKVSELETKKTELNAYLSPTSGDAQGALIASHWKDEINEKVKAMDNKIIALQKGGPDQGTKPTAAEIDAARDGVIAADQNGQEFKDNQLKKIFDDNKTELLGKEKKYLTALENLAKLISQVYKDKNSVTKTQLKAYSESNVSDENKEAWKWVNKVKDTSNKKIGEEALIKAKDDKDNSAELAAAKTTAKEALNKVIPGAGDAIITNALTDKSVVEGILAIFNECKTAWEKTEDDSSLRNKLEDYTSKKEWTAINLYQKDNKGNKCDAGFATGALNKLRGFVKKRQDVVGISKLDKAGNEAQVDAALVILEKSDDKVIKETVIPRGELMKALFKKGDAKSTALAKLIGENFVKELETDYADSTYATNLAKLKTKLEDLKKYKESDNKEVYTSLGTKEKGTFDSLLTSLKDKVKAMEKKEQEASEDPSKKNTEESGFWSSWKGYITIGLIVAVVLGGIVWLIKTNSSEEGEGESE